MKPYLPIMLLAGTTLWFAGCAHYQARPMSAENVAADFRSRTLTDAGLKVFAETNLHAPLPVWPLPSWDFTNLVLAAFCNSRELDVARAKWGVAKASIQVEDALQSPIGLPTAGGQHPPRISETAQ
jgi:cobalt-zinc-cadmium efflux system outer membrane protein